MLMLANEFYNLGPYVLLFYLIIFFGMSFKTRSHGNENLKQLISQPEQVQMSHIAGKQPLLHMRTASAQSRQNFLCLLT